MRSPRTEKRGWVLMREEAEKMRAMIANSKPANGA